jgi:hypothetical protein
MKLLLLATLLISIIIGYFYTNTNPNHYTCPNYDLIRTSQLSEPLFNIEKMTGF